MRGRIGSLLIVALVIAGLSAPSATAQEATPTSSADVLAGIAGVEDAVLRGYEPSGVRLVGTLYLAFVVVDFDTEPHAAGAFAMVVDRFLETIPDDSGGADMRPASARALGDDTIAFAGTASQEGTEAAIAIVGVRAGDLVHVGIGTALVGDPLADVLTVLEKTIGRPHGGSATPTGIEGMRAGGLWDALPRLDDLPDGFIFAEDRGLMDAASPAAATPAR